jgi:hypothetical protein
MSRELPSPHEIHDTAAQRQLRLKHAARSAASLLLVPVLALGGYCYIEETEKTTAAFAETTQPAVLGGYYDCTITTLAPRNHIRATSLTISYRPVELAALRARFDTAYNLNGYAIEPSIGDPQSIRFTTDGHSQTIALEDTDLGKLIRTDSDGTVSHDFALNVPDIQTEAITSASAKLDNATLTQDDISWPVAPVVPCTVITLR